MSVLLTMQVGPVDWNKFRAAAEWGYGQKPPGFLAGNVYRAEGDQNTVLVLEEWESHDAWHKFAEEFGAEFNSRAGTEGADWQDTIWAQSDAPSYH